MTPQRTFESPFGIGDHVRIDGNEGFDVIVTALEFRNERVLAECCWLANHEAKSAWIQVWRLSLIGKTAP